MIKPLFVSSRSVTFELQGDGIFTSAAAFDVYVDGILRSSDIRSNVFSLYGLIPATDHVIRVGSEEILVRTAEESAFLDVRSLGAKGEGTADDTLSIQSAILACPAGGTVFFPKGRYVVRPLFLKSHTTLYLDPEATLVGDPERGHYPILPASFRQRDGSLFGLASWEGESQPTFASLITGIDVEDVAIIGLGTLDGNAQNGDWWLHPRGMYGGAFRPRGVFLSHCRHITMQGLTVQNSPSWNIHPYMSSDMSFIDMKIISPKESPNTDGCNPESCDGVRILGVDFSVGDDCIAIKSGKYDPSGPIPVPCQNITIRNCRMRFGHGAVVLGSEMSGGIKDLSVSRCRFENTDRGLRIKTRRGRGKYGVIDGVTFEHISMDGVLTPLVMNMFYFCDDDGKTEYVWSKKPLPVDDRTPYLGRFTFRDMVCENAHIAAGFFYGLPERPIGSITLENICVRFAEKASPGIPAMMSFLEPMVKTGLVFRNVGKVLLKNVRLDGVCGEPTILEAVSSFKTT